MLVCRRGVCFFSLLLCSFCNPVTAFFWDYWEGLQQRNCKTKGYITQVLIMASKLSVLLLLLTVATVTVLAQRRRLTPTTNDDWNYKEGSDKVSMRNVANLTQVLDNWRFDILNQMRGLLQNDHQSLLPDYARIQPLSEALDDLYKEFNALKSHLGDLTEKFANIETFIDEVKAGRATSSNADSAPGLLPPQAPAQDPPQAPAQDPPQAPPQAPAPAPPPASMPRQTGTRRVPKRRNFPTTSQ